jgi:hypothetical protein
LLLGILILIASLDWFRDAFTLLDEIDASSPRRLTTVSQ